MAAEEGVGEGEQDQEEEGDEEDVGVGARARTGAREAVLVLLCPPSWGREGQREGEGVLEQERKIERKQK